MTNNLPITYTEEDHIINAAKDDAGFGRILSYAKGEYSLDKVFVPLGTEYRFYAKSWVQVWINFGPPVEQRIYQVVKGQKAPDRNSLGDLDQSKWPMGLDGRVKDPWVKQFLVQFENVETGELCAFRTSSAGGRRAVAELCQLCAFRSKRGDPSVAIIKLASTSFPTKNFGKVAKPQFDIVGWDKEGDEYHEIDPETISKPDAGGAAVPFEEDSIPF
jgi:hypothetical protein